jgi:hypothetical protein
MFTNRLCIDLSYIVDGQLPNQYGVVCVWGRGSISLVTPSFASAFAISMPLIIVSAWHFCLVWSNIFGVLWLLLMICLCGSVGRLDV